MRRRFFLAAALAALGTMVMPRVTRGQNSGQNSLVNALRQGGYILFFRHGTKGKGARVGAQLPLPLQSCSLPEEPLTDAGLTMMQTIGAHFQTLQIPIGKVYTSPVCRCVESAWFGFKQVEVKPELYGVIPEGMGTQEQIALNRQLAATLRGMLATPPVKRTNTVVVAHASNLLALMGLSLSEGEAAIFKPDGNGGFSLVQRLKAEEWATLPPKS
jgi:phosphohistidine phosphatase SixA